MRRRFCAGVLSVGAVGTASSRANGSTAARSVREQGSVVNAVESYLRKRGIAAPWRLECGPIEGVECAVVIPALAERAGILGTLRSLAANPRAELARALVVVVVNNRAPGVARAEDIYNQECWTAARADARRRIAEGRRDGGGADRPVSTPSSGFELPAKAGGFGEAHRAGRVLRVLHQAGAGEAAVCCLRTPYPVEPNYLERCGGTMRPSLGGLRRLRAPPDGADAEVAAVLAYETHLRCHVLGLRLANSPRVCQCGVDDCLFGPGLRRRGVNRRQAGEDFIFCSSSPRRVGSRRSTPRQSTRRRAPPTGCPSERDAGFRIVLTVARELVTYHLGLPRPGGLLRWYTNVPMPRPSDPGGAGAATSRPSF